MSSSSGSTLSDRADAELRVPHAQAAASSSRRRRLVLVLVGVGFGLFPGATAIAATPAERRETVRTDGWRSQDDSANADGTSSISSAGISSMNRDGSVDW